jgi:hypothetical protein
MVTVNLKAKHVYFISNTLKNIVASQFFGLLNRMKSATEGKADTDDVTVLISVDDLLYIYKILAEKPEGQANMINTEMSELLMPQVIAGVQSGNEEFSRLAQQIGEVRSANWKVTDEDIISGKTFLQS